MHSLSITKQWSLSSKTFNTFCLLKGHWDKAVNQNRDVEQIHCEVVKILQYYVADRYSLIPQQKPWMNLGCRLKMDTKPFVFEPLDSRTLRLAHDRYNRSLTLRTSSSVSIVASSKMNIENEWLLQVLLNIIIIFSIFWHHNNAEGLGSASGKNPTCKLSESLGSSVTGLRKWTGNVSF